MVEKRNQRAARKAKAKPQKQTPKIDKTSDLKPTSFADWLAGVPAVGEAETLKVDVGLELYQMEWFLLARAAAYHKTTIAKIIAYFVTDYSGGLSEWSSSPEFTGYWEVSGQEKGAL